MTDRQDVFPAASVARIVIRFAPTSSGTVVVQFVVPVAVPVPPVEFVQVTDLTPTLSDDVPLKTIVDAVVSAFVVAGDRMLRLGGVVSLPGCVGVGVGAGVCVGVCAGA